MMYDLSIFFDIAKVFFPLALFVWMVFIMVIVTIVKAIRCELPYENAHETDGQSEYPKMWTLQDTRRARRSHMLSVFMRRMREMPHKAFSTITLPARRLAKRHVL